MNREWIYGRQAVREVLRAGRRIPFLLRIAEGSQEQKTLADIISLARKQNLPVERVNRRNLDRIAENHQGVAIQTGEYPLVHLEDILAQYKQSESPPLVLILDQIQDPQNLASLLRTAEAAGVKGVVIPLRRSAGITPAVVNASAGAVEHLQIAQANLIHAITEMKKRGIWIAGLDASPEAQPIFQAELDGPLALVVGSEGEGLRPLVKKSCDLLFQIPMYGKIQSLNAAVAGSIGLYLALFRREQRRLT
jgi:23S rRNA (guanosine2251-2'-O)-methyltransferase